jgi:hypothetical protein
LLPETVELTERWVPGEIGDDELIEQGLKMFGGRGLTDNLPYRSNPC